MSCGSTNLNAPDPTVRKNDELVAITWADAHSIDNEEWRSFEALNFTDEEYLVVSVGWMLPDKVSKKNHVVIYQSRTPDDDLDHILVIPRGMIRVIEKLSSYCGSRDA